jgi:hypothetical protein
MIFASDVRGLRALGRLSYGDDAGDAGTAVGTGVGTGLVNLIKGFTTGGGTSGGAPSPGPQVIGYQQTWWDQQSLGTKFLIGGAGFLTAAGLVAWIRSRSKKMTK